MEPERMELLVRLLSAHQENLFRYIFSLLPHEEDARDVLQETSVALYRKFAEYARMDTFSAVWPSMARWIAQENNADPGNPPVRVQLRRHWWFVPPRSVVLT